MRGSMEYALPLLFVACAALSVFVAWQRTRPGGRARAALRELTHHEFETLLAEAFRIEGYSVRELGSGSVGRGADMLLAKGERVFVVLLRDWRAARVGGEAIEELHQAMSARRAGGGFVVTAGRFSNEAMEIADALGIELVNGARLARMLEQARLFLLEAAHQRGALGPGGQQ